MNIDGGKDEHVEIEVDTSDGVKQVNALSKAYDTLIEQLTKLSNAGANFGSKFGAAMNGIGQSIKNAQNAGSNFGSGFSSAMNGVSNAFFNAQLAGTVFHQKMGGVFSNVSTMLGNMATNTVRFGQNFNAATASTNMLGSAFGGLSSAISGIGNAFGNFQNNMRQSQQGMHEFFTVLKDIRGGMWALIDVVKLMTEPFMILAGIIGGVGGKIVETLNVLQGFKATMSILTTSSSEVGASWNFLKGIADTLGVELTSLTGSYGKLLAAIPDGNDKLKTAQNLFLGVASAARTLHASNHDTQLMFYAITQMASKARISMEELNRQLGEKLPGMMRIMADKLSTTPDKLMDAIKKGTVDSIKFLEQMGPALWAKFFGSAQVASQSVDAAINRLKNLWVETVKYMDDQGIGPLIAGLFDTIRDKLSDPSVGKEFYKTVRDITEQLTKFVKNLSAQDIKEGFDAFFSLVKAGTEIMLNLGRAAAWSIEQIRKAKKEAEDSPNMMSRFAKGMSYFVDPLNIWGARKDPKTDAQQAAGGQLATGRLTNAQGKVIDANADWRRMENQYVSMFPKEVAPKTLEQVLAPGKEKKHQLSEGERYIKMLEQMEDRTEKLTETEKIESALREGRLHFDSQTQKNMAFELAKRIDLNREAEKDRKLSEQKELHLNEINKKYNEYLQNLKDGVDDLQRENDLLGMNAHQQEMARAAMDGRQKILKELRSLEADAMKYKVPFDSVAKEKELTAELQKQLALREQIYQAQRTPQFGIVDWFNKLNEAATNSAAIIQEALTGAFDASSSALENFLNTGKLDFKKWVSDITQMVNRMVSREIMTSLFNYIRSVSNGGQTSPTAGTGGGLLMMGWNALSSLWSAGSSFGAGGALAASSFSSNIGASAAAASLSSGTVAPINSFNALFAGASANGNAFIGGNPQYFARGGIVHRTTGFGMSGGRWGVMGEAGPEGILPLARDSQGRLGVRGGGGGGNVYMNVVTPDADSFNKSKNQIMNQANAQIRRLARRG